MRRILNWSDMDDDDKMCCVFCALRCRPRCGIEYIVDSALQIIRTKTRTERARTREIATAKNRWKM